MVAVIRAVHTADLDARTRIFGMDHLAIADVDSTVGLYASHSIAVIIDFVGSHPVSALVEGPGELPASSAPEDLHKIMPTMMRAYRA